MTRPALAIDELSVRDAAGHVLVRPISLAVPAGNALVMIGETGSGKSLIAQAVMGLLPPGITATGTLTLGDGTALRLDAPGTLTAMWARRLMLLPQEPAAALDPTKRLGRQLARPAMAEAQVAEALRAVDLPPGLAQSYPFSLSGGMAQRALIGCALLSDAPLVIADEPTKGLDPERIDRVIALLRDLLARGRTLLVITHELRVARGLGGQVVVLQDGAVVEAGAVEATLEAPRHAYTRAWLTADPARWPACDTCLTRDDLVLAAHGLGFAWPRQRPLIAGLDLHLPRGGVVALTGPSGCGKTTAGNILLGLLPPGSGEVSWAGADPYRDPRARARLRQRYQKLHQDPASAFVPYRTIGRQLADLAEVKPGLDIAAALPPLLERLRLHPGLLARHPAEVSGGEAQRLALARLLLLDPDVILADEPTSRLDPIVQRETMLLLRQVVEERRMGMVLISHDRALVAAVSDEVVTLRHGA